MEDMMLRWLDFLCPMVLGLMLIIGATVCALFIAIIGAVVTAAVGFITAFTGRKKCSLSEHNRCCGASRRKK